MNFTREYTVHIVLSMNSKYLWQHIYSSVSHALFIFNGLFFSSIEPFVFLLDDLMLVDKQIINFL